MSVPLKSPLLEHFELFPHYVVAAGGAGGGATVAPWCWEAERSADAHV